MLIMRALGFVLLLLAIAALAWELAAWLRHGYWQILSAGELWFQLDNASLNLVQAVVQRYLLPEIWDPGIQTILLWPTWIVLGIPALILLIITGFRGRRRPFV
jgi:hypothetical protein